MEKVIISVTVLTFIFSLIYLLGSKIKKENKKKEEFSSLKSIHNTNKIVYYNNPRVNHRPSHVSVVDYVCGVDPYESSTPSSTPDYSSFTGGFGGGEFSGGGAGGSWSDSSSDSSSYDGGGFDCSSSCD